MLKGFYAKLAFDNLKKNRKIYAPFILTCIITVAMFYIITSLAGNTNIKNMRGGGTILDTLNFGKIITGIFAVIFLFYTYSFIIKRRKKEFGLFNILGMEKRHIGIVLAFEILYIALISLITGFLFGFLLDRLMCLIIAFILNSDYGVGFTFSKNAFIVSIVLFSVIFILMYLWSFLRVQIAQPVELLKGGNVGEKEPKAKWLVASIGLICLVVGYVLAVTAQNGVSAIEMFFVAAVLVIIGTYLLFTAGSIALLKILKKNKKFYYQTSHFTSISGMTYRMKQNAVGLANICILATMALVMVSTTASFMFGRNDMLMNRYPYDMMITSSDLSQTDEVAGNIQSLIDEEGIETQNTVLLNYLTFTSVCNGNHYDAVEPNFSDFSKLNILFLLSLDTYNEISGENKSLAADEVLIYSGNHSFQYSTIKITDTEYNVSEKIDSFVRLGAFHIVSGLDHTVVIVKSEDIIEEIYEKQKAVYGDDASEIQMFYGFDVVGGDETKVALYNAIRSSLKNCGIDAEVECRTVQKDSFMSFYGGFFFIGVYLGVLFLMAAILIIYYKQISEGFEDKDRFAIMQKVGMSYREVKRSIGSQILTVFFMPLIAAGVHVAFAFPMINSILAALNMTNTALFAVCTASCFAIFSAIYVVVYLLTAKVYYRIVKNNRG